MHKTPVIKSPQVCIADQRVISLFTARMFKNLDACVIVRSPHLAKAAALLEVRGD